MMGRITEAGMGGINDPEVGSAGGIALAICDVKVDVAGADCANVEFAVPFDRDVCAGKGVSPLIDGPDAEPGITCGAGSLLNTNGVDVRGGGNGAPFGSPRTLRFRGGSSTADDLPFLPPLLESLPPEAALVAARASCSSNMRSESASTAQ